MRLSLCISRKKFEENRYKAKKNLASSLYAVHRNRRERLSQNFHVKGLPRIYGKKKKKKKVWFIDRALRRLYADGIHECAQVANRIVDTRAKLVGFRAGEPRFRADEPNSLSLPLPLSHLLRSSALSYLPG